MQALKSHNVNAARLPFFSFEQNPYDSRFGKIVASSDQMELLGELAYFHGKAGELSEKSGEKEAFFITGLSFSKDIRTRKLERALMYIAACMADDAGEDVIYCKPAKEKWLRSYASDLWEIVGVQKLLEQYDSVVEAV